MLTCQNFNKTLLRIRNDAATGQHCWLHLSVLQWVTEMTDDLPTVNKSLHITIFKNSQASFIYSAELTTQVRF